jgi:tetratricopeptide (TPR) repeat protein
MASRKIILIVAAICISGMALMGKKVLDNQVFAPTCAAKEVAISVNPQQIAESITVKVFSGNGGGSGTLVAKQGQVYTVLTNQHVLTPGEPYRIQTPDGVVYQANAVRNVNFGKNDLALLQFRADADYAVAVLAALETRFLQETGFLGNLAVNQEVFAAGFPYDSEKLTFNNGKISLLPDKSLKDGYRIGYTNDIQKGMSGGPILNSQGQVIGINGGDAYALFGNPYVFEDGSQPSDAQKEEMKRLSWGIPIQIVVQAVPQLAANNLVKNVERIAQEVTVLITFPNGNGSGVIIAQQGNTYYVLTANHVVRNETQYQVTTPDGRCYPVNYRTVKKFEGVDLAVLEFKSDRSYRVATLGNYDLDNDFIFVSGWAASRQSGKGKHSRLFASGELFNQEKAFFRAKDFGSFIKGYEMLYTNITAGGVSGGAVLDTRGRLIGIHRGAEGEVTLDEAGQESRIQLGYSFGVPINTFLSLAKQVGMQSELLKLDTSPPPQITAEEVILIVFFPNLKEVPADTASAIDWLNFGNQLWRVGEQEEAIKAFNRAIHLKQNFYQAWYLRGLMLSFDKRYQEAIESFNIATQIEPKLYNAWRWQALSLLQLNRYQEALISCDRAIKLNPKDSWIHSARGAILNSLKRDLEAKDAFTLAIEISPHYSFYYFRGNTRADLGDKHGAIADYNEAIRLKPDYADAYNNRGLAYSNLKEYQKAIADFNEAIRLKPDYADAYRYRGGVHVELKEYQQAIADYNQAISIKPDYADAYFNRGGVHVELKEYQKAIADFNEAIRLKPDHADVYFNRGAAHFQLKEYQKVIADYNEAIRLKPDDADAYNNRGAAHFRLKEYQKAIADYNEAIRLKSNYAITYNNRGLAYAHLKEYQKAIVDFNEVIRIKPDDADAYNNRGLAKNDLGDKERASADFQKASQLFQQQGDMAEYQKVQEMLKKLQQ